ncbi:hypothetical protein ACFC1T_09095 [Kitasatospora sp. NPDC056076]|uniref:hypothetical protein n=1 Tax=Kitasatospora sp. NPDC056076 TaxID=3345703 RepID=UPI0035D92834
MTDHQPLPQTDGAEWLPAAQEFTTLLPAPPRIVNDLTRDLTNAADAIRGMEPRRGADVTLAAYTAVVCTGSTAARALEEAALWCRQAPDADIHATSWARVPGHREDVFEYRITMSVGFPDHQTGEPGTVAHNARR